MSRIQDLSNKIIQARSDYYNKQPTVSDQVFDAWGDELKDLDSQNKAITMIGTEAVPSEWKLEKHNIPLGSLNKCSTDQEIEDWVKKTGCQDWVLSYKIDGLSIECIYEEGKFIKAITRGNGVEGALISSNVVKMQGFLPNLPQNISCSLRGEIYLKKSDHKEYFPDYSNARNAASGISKRLDGQGSEHLSLMFYECVSDNVEFHTEMDKFLFIANDLGLDTPYESHWAAEAEHIISQFRYIQDDVRNQLNFDIDGMVLTINSISHQLDLGSTNMRPKYSMALKFEAEKRETLVKDIIWQTGSSGRITPVAIVEPVKLAGAVVERCTLNNVSFMQNLGVSIGSLVLIKRSGEVIPTICSVIANSVSEIDYPKQCPVCEEETYFDGEYLVCSNYECPAQISGRIKNWVNKLNLLDVGDTLIERLVENGIVSDISDLYRLTLEDLLSIERMGEKSANTVLNMLNSNKELTLEKFLGSLSIPTIGETVVSLITSAGYSTLDSIRSASKEDFSKINGLGPVKSENLYEGLQSCSELMEDLMSSGINIKEKKGSLLGKSFCFTGALKTMKRPEAQKMVVDAGGTVKSSVTSDLTYLVMDDPNSDSIKANKARKNGTKCISEQQFLDMVK